MHMYPKHSLRKPLEQPKQRSGRKPLRTFTEMAEEFGVSVQQLSIALATCKGDKPIPKLKSFGSVARNTYYDPAEMRAWWKKYQSNKGAANA